MNKTDDQLRRILTHIYSTAPPKVLSKEAMDSVRVLVNRIIIPGVKFIKNEFIDGKSKKRKERDKKFPSFWEPDLTVKVSLQREILDAMSVLKNSTLQEKARYWMGIRDKVLDTIRQYRNNTTNKIKKDAVEGTVGK